MKVIEARNINQAWDRAKILLNASHVTRSSRVGEVWEHGTPVTTEYQKPTERVLFNAERNPNPIFHLMESLWMLAGRNDVAWIEKFNSKIRDFVGPDDEQWGAYGYRWRKFFDMDGGAEDDEADQLKKIIRMLKANPNERRAVLTMWSPLADLERPEKADLPCNTQVYFKIRNGALCILVTCRSNDICFGAYGSNSVQFSMLLEYMAAMIGVPVGTYWQVSDSWHAYTERWNELGGFNANGSIDFYTMGVVEAYPMVETPETWDDDLETFMDGRFDDGYDNPFFPLVVMPLWYSWQQYKLGDLSSAQRLVSRCEASDWRTSAEIWYNRVAVKRLAKAEAK